jgi:quercetin dioxygenase-like cupin family protein
MPTTAVLVAMASLESIASPQGVARGTERVLDNSHVRAFRLSGAAPAGINHGPAVLVSLDAVEDEKRARAIWVDDAASAAAQVRGAVVVVQPLSTNPPRGAASGSKPGEAPFTGMSFRPLFENDRVSVIRARMEVGAREGFHTHASDTVVVHLSGGEIEDTADARTVVNRWKQGDVEFEARGSSHSARNLGAAVDVVLVVLKSR